jgi:hypothetical protein
MEQRDPHAHSNALRRLYRALRTDKDGRLTLHGDDQRR